MDWMQDAARALAVRVGYFHIPAVMSADGIRAALKLAYEQRAEYNLIIDRAEHALREMVNQK